MFSLFSRSNELFDGVNVK